MQWFSKCTVYFEPVFLNLGFNNLTTTGNIRFTIKRRLTLSPYYFNIYKETRVQQKVFEMLNVDGKRHTFVIYGQPLNAPCRVQSVDRSSFSLEKKRYKERFGWKWSVKCTSCHPEPRLETISRLLSLLFRIISHAQLLCWSKTASRGRIQTKHSVLWLEFLYILWHVEAVMIRQSVRVFFLRCGLVAFRGWTSASGGSGWSLPRPHTWGRWAEVSQHPPLRFFVKNHLCKSPVSLLN